MKVVKIYEIEEDYCSFEVAKLLKEKGVSFELNPYNSISYLPNGEINYWEDDEDCVISPPLQMVIKWLRVAMNMWVWVEPVAETVDGVTDLMWKYCHKKRLRVGNNYTGCGSVRSEDEYATPEEAINNAIKIIIEDISINKQNF